MCPFRLPAGDPRRNSAFYALSQAAPDAIITSDADNIIIYANPSAGRILGYADGEMLGQSLSMIIPERFRAAHHAGMARLLATGQPRLIGKTIELVACHRTGKEFPIELSLSMWTESDATYFTAIVRDITDRKYNEEALKKESATVRLLQQVTAAANEAPTIEQAMLACLEFVCAHTGWPLGHVFFTNPALTQLELQPTNLWYPAHEEAYEDLRLKSGLIPMTGDEGIVGQVIRSHGPIWIDDLAAENDLPRKPVLLAAGLKSAFAFPVITGASVAAVMEFFTPTPTPRDEYLLSIIEPVGIQLGRVIERVKARQRILEAALRDPLTGLPNRVAFSDAIKRAIRHMSRRPGYAFAVLFIDLDRFKIINDSLGHDVGDSLLMEVASRLSETLRSPDMVSRLGGDEFAIFIDDLNERTDGASAVKIANRILAQLQAPCAIGGEEVYTSASIGVAFGTTGYKEPEELLRDADTAMYRAKKAGKGRVEVFNPEMRDKVLTQLKLENDLRRAIDNQEFFLTYQPVVCISSRQVLGFEALIRWNHPTRGVVSPNDFIEIAEETGLIAPIGWWVLTEACHWLAQLHRDKPDTRHLRINVNVSAVQMGLKLVDRVQKALQASGLPPGSLKLEITESSLIVTESLGGEKPLEQLRALGVELLIDDFGTGYSSLARLSQLPIDALKIDRSFVENLAESEESVEIAKCIIAMAAALGIGVIAEGVETPEQAQALLNLGCEQAQGYHYSRPLGGKDASEMMM